MATKRTVLIASAALLLATAPASAQVDPLLFLKRIPPNVIVAVDVANRMQRDAPSDPANPRTSSAYYDMSLYRHQNNATWETLIGVTAVNTSQNYFRKISGMNPSGSGSNFDQFDGTRIDTVGDLQGAAYTNFAAPTRLAIARAALYQAIVENKNVARFGLIKMRQSQLGSISTGNTGSSGPVVTVTDTTQQGNAGIQTDRSSNSGQWNVTLPTVSNSNKSVKNGSVTTSGLLTAADASSANDTILTTLGKGPRDTGTSLVPYGLESAKSDYDTPVKFMLDDAKAEAVRLIGADTVCRNTVVVLIVGGGEGTTAAGVSSSTLTSAASAFLSVASGRRVPIYVIAIAPPSADVAQLQAVAANSGGQYFEITKSQIDTAMTAGVSGTPSGTIVVPAVVRAINIAVQDAFEQTTDFNTAPTTAIPIGAYSEFQVTSPVIGTVNLESANDINGNVLPNTRIVDKQSNVIPQRANVMLTTAFTLPGFNASIRAYRMYKPCSVANAATECPDRADSVITSSGAVSGYKFISDGTPLWVACAPGTTTTGPCSSLPATSRNLFTVMPSGLVVAFTPDNATLLAPFLSGQTMAPTGFDATGLINFVRSMPLGAIVSSTPAVMDPPSLDPPPDADYPAFVDANKTRRSIVWVAANDGILHAIDGRLGVEVWGFIPFNLLPKLKTLRDGQPVGSFTYLADGSPKIADVKISGSWRTYLFVGQGAGGTFYNTFDVTLAGMGSSVYPTDNSISTSLAYFADSSRVKFKWSFPQLSSFDYTIATTAMPFGDISKTASTLEKTVGQTWSDPAVGEVQDGTGQYVMIVGSGFFPYTPQTATNRANTVAGTSLYMIDVSTGNVLDSKDIGSDGSAETVDDCSAAGNCQVMKNALQADPVATGPSDSRFITKAYIGDLDGRVWRFAIGKNTSGAAAFTSDPVMLYNASLVGGNGKSRKTGATQPVFSSMATVNVGGVNQYVFFGTGSDLLPSTGVDETYMLIGFVDNGTAGTETFTYALTPVAHGTANEEKVSSFPAVAGDIVFFTTTTFKPQAPCTNPDANLYALTYIGGPAYDNTGDNTVSSKDTPKVKTIAGTRATAPFVVDQHLVFGNGTNVAVFGDPQDYDNGVGQAGVRILSWREVR